MFDYVFEFNEIENGEILNLENENKKDKEFDDNDACRNNKKKT